MPQGNNRSQPRVVDPTMFDVDVLAKPQIDLVLDFQISLALWNDKAQSIEFGSTNWRKLGFFRPSNV